MWENLGRLMNLGLGHCVRKGGRLGSSDVEIREWVSTWRWVPLSEIRAWQCVSANCGVSFRFVIEIFNILKLILIIKFEV